MRRGPVAMASATSSAVTKRVRVIAAPLPGSWSVSTNHEPTHTNELEIDLRPDLEIPRLQDQCRPLPPVRGGIGTEPGRDRLPVVRIKQIVDVHRHSHTAFPVREQLLADAYVELLGVATE